MAAALARERHVPAGLAPRRDALTTGRGPGHRDLHALVGQGLELGGRPVVVTGGSSVTRRVITSVGTVWNMVSVPSLVWSARTTTSAAAWTRARSTLAESMLDVDRPRSAVSPLPERKARETRSPWRDCSAPLPTSA